MKRPLPELPLEVAAHVRAKLLAYDWEQQASQLRTLCEGCPAERAGEICAFCPLEGVALSAAHVAMQAKIGKAQGKIPKHKKSETAVITNCRKNGNG